MPEADQAIPGTRKNRIIAAVLMCLTVGLLLFAGHLDSPAEAAALQASGDTPTALATFGYPGCGFKSMTGLPCASCGMTRAFTFMADGNFISAFIMQPAGALLCLGVAMLALVSAWSLVTAMPVGPLFGAVFRPKPVVAGVIFLLVIWVLNILRTLLGA